MTRIRARAGALVAGLVASALVAVIAYHTTAWVGTSFPGFFVIPNRVVPSSALPGWGPGATAFFQSAVMAVDGQPVESAEAVYEYARSRVPGTPVTYTVRNRDGVEWSASIPVRRFTGSDYALLFGAFLVTAIAFFGTGLMVVALTQTPASVGLLVVGVVTGTFAATACDLYGPYWFVRLHVIAESLLGFSAVHLALVFPTERLGRARRSVLAALYLGGAALATVYEIALSHPRAYTTLHLYASATHAAGAVVLIALATWHFFRSRAPLVRRKVVVVAVGVLGAFVLPALLMGGSAVLGGTVPVNAAAFTALLFPVSVAYAILQRDLFEIDRLLRRAVTYGLVLLVLGIAYFGTLAFVVAIVSHGGLLERSPLALATLNFALGLLVASVRARVQTAVDRLFFRQPYDARHELSQLSHTLVTVHTEGHVLAHARAILARTVCPARVVPLLLHESGKLVPIDGNGQLEVQAQDELARRLGHGEVVARYEWEEGSPELPAPFGCFDVELLVPIPADASVLVVALGRKENGRLYTPPDVEFLRGFAGQVALGLTNARAFASLALLNASLERQVENRTASLAEANASLNESLAELRGAYARLEQSQASLVRADRLATLGRLTAGIAHEVSTPLGAVVNALKLLTELGEEYQQSVGNPTVTLDDHREVAGDIITQSRAALGWARKAAAFVNRVRVHSREKAPRDDGRFALAAVFEETEALVAHRARAVETRLEFDNSEGIIVPGDRVRLGQVLLNLVQNAIDAYEDARVRDGRVAVCARREGDHLAVTVRDWAGGIPADVLPHIFEELFTTKEPGRGTGIGLWIARNLVEQSFGGTLDVEVQPGVGSTFTIALPLSKETETPAGAAPPIAGDVRAHA
jgi:signal transduction histidine kinase